MNLIEKEKLAATFATQGLSMASSGRHADAAKLGRMALDYALPYFLEDDNIKDTNMRKLTPEQIAHFRETLAKAQAEVNAKKS